MLRKTIRSLSLISTGSKISRRSTTSRSRQKTQSQSNLSISNGIQLSETNQTNIHQKTKGFDDHQSKLFSTFTNQQQSSNKSSLKNNDNNQNNEFSNESNASNNNNEKQQPIQSYSHRMPTDLKSKAIKQTDESKEIMVDLAKLQVHARISKPGNPKIVGNTLSQVSDSDEFIGRLRRFVSQQRTKPWWLGFSNQTLLLERLGELGMFQDQWTYLTTLYKTGKEQGIDMLCWSDFRVALRYQAVIGNSDGVNQYLKYMEPNMKITTKAINGILEGYLLFGKREFFENALTFFQTYQQPFDLHTFDFIYEFYLSQKDPQLFEKVWYYLGQQTKAGFNVSVLQRTHMKSLIDSYYSEYKNALATSNAINNHNQNTATTNPTQEQIAAANNLSQARIKVASLLRNMANQPGLNFGMRALFAEDILLMFLNLGMNNESFEWFLIMQREQPTISTQAVKRAMELFLEPSFIQKRTADQFRATLNAISSRLKDSDLLEKAWNNMMSKPPTDVKERLKMDFKNLYHFIGYLYCLDFEVERATKILMKAIKESVPNHTEWYRHLFDAVEAKPSLFRDDVSLWTTGRKLKEQWKELENRGFKAQHKQLAEAYLQKLDSFFEKQHQQTVQQQ